jgi:hypothetical protein
MSMTMAEFFAVEKESKDTIDFKKIYVDMASCDLLAGLALSEIVYWHLPSKTGSSKLRVEHDGKLWIAVRRYEWWDRARITPDQSDRAIRILVDEGLIEKKLYKFNGDPTIHIRIIEERFLSLYQELAGMDRRNPFMPEPKSISAETEKGIALNVIPLTEGTAEITPEKNDNGAAAPRPPEGKPKAKPKAKRDERLDQPAILLVRGVTNAYPPKASFDFIIEKLGETPDGPKFATAYQTWCTRGNKPTNLEGVIDWYLNGVPPQYKPAYGKAGTPAPANPPEADYTAEREAIKKATIAKRLAAREGQNANAQASPQ